MTPREVKDRLFRMQKSSVALVMILAKHNKDINEIVTAIDKYDECALADGMHKLGISCMHVARCLEEYCDASEYFLGGLNGDQG